jgi:hypothetical protein
MRRGSEMKSLIKGYGRESLRYTGLDSVGSSTSHNAIGLHGQLRG